MTWKTFKAICSLVSALITLFVYVAFAVVVFTDQIKPGTIHDVIGFILTVIGFYYVAMFLIGIGVPKPEKPNERQTNAR